MQLVTWFVDVDAMLKHLGRDHLHERPTRKERHVHRPGLSGLAPRLRLETSGKRSGYAPLT